MWASNPPDLTVGEAARACARGIGDAELRRRVEEACPEFEANSARLRAGAAGGRLHETRAGDYSVGGLSRENLLWLYTSQLVRRRRPGREIYDKIMVSARYGLCVYCRHNLATTLDHFVPKSLTPGLSIDPWNLVPACSDCNHGLLDSFSEEPDGQLLHPYFVPEIGRWLTASVDHGQPVAVRFRAEPATSLAPELRARIRNQFATLGLARRYSVICGGELTGLSRRLGDRFGGADPGEVSGYLSELADLAFATDGNDRRGVMFEALAADEWYCAGGYAPPLEVAA
jgi:hypothetical protein